MRDDLDLHPPEPVENVRKKKEWMDPELPPRHPTGHLSVFL